MPRPPKLDSTDQLIFQAKTEQDRIIIKAFKEICWRNGLFYKNEIKRLIHDQFLVKEHRWPPGNSQTVLKSFTEDSLEMCSFCHSRAVGSVKHIATDKVYSVCEDHLKGATLDKEWSIMTEHLEQSRGESKWKETKR